MKLAISEIQTLLNETRVLWEPTRMVIEVYEGLGHAQILYDEKRIILWVNYESTWTRDTVFVAVAHELGHLARHVLGIRDDLTEDTFEDSEDPSDEFITWRYVCEFDAFHRGIYYAAKFSVPPMLYLGAIFEAMHVQYGMDDKTVRKHIRQLRSRYTRLGYGKHWTNATSNVGLITTRHLPSTPWPELLI